MLKLTLQFIISGTVVVLATSVGEKVSQKWAGLLVAFPVWTVLTFIFLNLDKQQGNFRTYLWSALIFMIPSAVLISTLIIMRRQNVWLGLALGFTAYVLITVVIMSIFKSSISN